MSLLNLCYSMTWMSGLMFHYFKVVWICHYELVICALHFNSRTSSDFTLRDCSSTQYPHILKSFFIKCIGEYKAWEFSSMWIRIGLRESVNSHSTFNCDVKTLLNKRGIRLIHLDLPIHTFSTNHSQHVNIISVFLC